MVAVLTLAPVGAVAQACPGDCDGDGAVRVSEFILAVNTALGGAPLTACAALDPSGTGRVEVVIDMTFAVSLRAAQSTGTYDYAVSSSGCPNNLQCALAITARWQRARVPPPDLLPNAPGDPGAAPYPRSRG